MKRNNELCERPEAALLPPAGARLEIGIGFLALIVTGVCMARTLLQPWEWMWLLAFAVFASLKVLTIFRLSSVERARLTAGRLMGYLFLWPGMRPQPFMNGAATAADAPLVREGLMKLCAGGALLWIVPHGLPSKTPDWMRAWVGMVGISLVLHFGLFHLLAAAWRRAGVPVEPIFLHPTRAASLGEFWGTRWNRAFADFSRDQILRPLARRAGARSAGFAVFAFSGLVHELVISVPAGGGHGLPTVYFLLQGVFVLAEGSRPDRALLRGHPWLGRLWTWAAVLGPAVLLFPPPFLQQIVVPFLRAIGAA